MDIDPQDRGSHVAPWPPADLEQLGDEITELSAHLEAAATARLLRLIREFDARQGWATGFRSCAEWLGWKVGLNPGAAREKVRVARALGDLPQFAAALGRGELSYAKGRALTRIATPQTEARLLAVAQAGTASQVEQIVRGWRRVNRGAEAEEANRRHQSRALTVYHDDDGMVVVRGRLEPEAGALLLRALEAAREAGYQKARGAAGTNPAEPTAADPAGEGPTVAQRQADALAPLAETALHHGLDPGPPGERYQVVVHVDAPVLADPEAPGQSVHEGVPSPDRRGHPGGRHGPPRGVQRLASLVAIPGCRHHIRRRPFGLRRLRHRSLATHRTRSIPITARGGAA